MGSNSGKFTKLPLVSLAKGSVLLPGVTLLIPVSNRPDLTNLLSSLVDRPWSTGPSAMATRSPSDLFPSAPRS